MPSPEIEFEFFVQRSQKKADQSPRFSCKTFEFGGRMKATSIYRVRDFCATLLVIPGVYTLRMRNVNETEWFEYPYVDTRNPEAAAAILGLKRSRRPKKK